MKMYNRKKLDDQDNSKIENIAKLVPNGTKKRVKEAVMLLLRFAPARYRIFALQCEGAPTQARISQLNASLMAVYRQVSRYGNLDNMKSLQLKYVSHF